MILTSFKERQKHCTYIAQWEKACLPLSQSQLVFSIGIVAVLAGACVWGSSSVIVSVWCGEVVLTASPVWHCNMAASRSKSSPSSSYRLRLSTWCRVENHPRTNASARCFQRGVEITCSEFASISLCVGSGLLVYSADNSFVTWHFSCLEDCDDEEDDDDIVALSPKQADKQVEDDMEYARRLQVCQRIPLI